MALRQVATTTVTEEVVLKPALKKKLLTELRTFQALKGQKDAIELAMAAHKGNIEDLRESTGAKSLDIDGFKITHISPIRKVLDHKKLIALGCAQAWIEEATKSVPTKSYEKVTCPGEKERDYE